VYSCGLRGLETIINGRLGLRAAVWLWVKVRERGLEMRPEIALRANRPINNNLCSAPYRAWTEALNGNIKYATNMGEIRKWKSFKTSLHCFCTRDVLVKT